MGVSDTSVLAPAGFSLSVAGVVFILIGVSTNFWITSPTDGGYIFHTGLFEHCVSGPCYHCTDIKEIPDWFVSSRAAIMIGLVLGLVSVVVQIIHVIQHNEKKVLQLLGVASTFVAAAFVIFGTLIFAVKQNTAVPSPLHMGRSMVMTVVGGGIFLFAGLLQAQGRNKTA